MEEQKEETLNENNDSLNVEEELEETQEEESNEEVSDDTPTLEDFNEAKAKLKELEEKNKQLYARLKKTEQLPKKDNKETEISEEQLLRVAKLATSLDDEDLEVLKTIVGNSIAEKVDNPLFKAYKAQKDKKKRSEASALRPSTPGMFTGKKNPNDPNLSKEEHKKLVEQLLG